LFLCKIKFQDISGEFTIVLSFILGIVVEVVSKGEIFSYHVLSRDFNHQSVPFPVYLLFVPPYFYMECKPKKLC